MALTSVGIQQARETYGKITGEEPKLTNLEEVLNFMDTNRAFREFVSGTTFGSEFFEKWQGLVSLVSGDLYQALANMDYATRKFLDRQEEINNRKMGSSSNLSSGSSIGTSGSTYIAPSFRNADMNFVSYK